VEMIHECNFLFEQVINILEETLFSVRCISNILFKPFFEEFYIIY